MIVFNNMDSLVPVYMFMLLLSVAILFFKIGSTYSCDNKHKVEYRFIPRTQEELEKHTQPSDVLSDFV